MKDLEEIPNRAPSFSAIYGSEKQFLARNLHRAVEYSEPDHRNDSEQLQSIVLNKRIPAGFSQRRLSGAINRMVGGKIVSEHEGRITKLLVTIPRYDEEGLRKSHVRHYESLFRSMGDWCTYIVLCDPQNKAQISSIADGAGVSTDRLTFALSPQFDYTIWAQDAYVALNDASGRPILLEGVSFPRGDDMTIADDVASQTDVSHLQSFLYFQGGNILGAQSSTLIGMDYIQRNVTRFGLETVDKVVAAFSESLGTPVIPLGGPLFDNVDWYRRGILSGHGYQPIFHIDMYVTPTGVTGPSGKEIAFLGKPSEAKRVVGRWSDIDELNSSKYDSLFDLTEAQLGEHFEVRYLPLWITTSQLGQPRFEERYYNLTFNNCIVQNHPDGRSVLLPFYSQDSATYGVDSKLREDLEAASKEAWESIGFEVSFMDGIEDLAYGSGAVHCITKALARTA